MVYPLPLHQPHAPMNPLRFLALLAVTGSFALLSTPASAQLTLGLQLEGGVPQDEFSDGLDDVGFGLAGQLLYGVGPVALGAEGGVLTYGEQGRPLDARLDGQSAFLGEVTSAQRVGHLHAVVRLQVPDGPVRPYVDGLVGFNRFYAETRFEQAVVLVDDGFFDADFGDGAVDRYQATTSVDTDDYALSYGAGGGLLVRLAHGRDDGTPFAAFLDLGVRYLIGETATYMVDPAARLGDRDVPVARLVRSETDLLRPQLGLVVQFGG